MSIVLNEDEWALSAIENKQLGKDAFETLRRVARYYMDNGCSKKEAREQLDKFLTQCDSSASLAKWSKTLDTAVKRAARFDSVRINKISITVPEFETIKGLKGIQLQRLAFTLLCLSKYWNEVNPNANGWVSTSDTEVVSIANITTSIIRQNKLYHSLYELGLIQLPKRVDSTSVRVCYIQPGDTEMEIDDFRNLGYQYMLHIGDKTVFKCQACGVVSKKKTHNEDKKSGPKQKYCQECASSMKIKQSVNSVMRLRHK